MPKPIKQSQRPQDLNQLAHHLVRLSTQEAGDSTEPPPTSTQISMLMAELGRKGGKVGGKRRLQTMTAKERRRIAKRAAKVRWGKR